MNKRWARIFLAAMTAVCLAGAWRTPFRLPLPEDGKCKSIRVERAGFDGWYECSIENTPQQAALIALLRETDLRRCSPLGSYGGLVEPGDFYYCMNLTLPQHGTHIQMSVGCRDGREYGEGQLLNAHVNLAYRIPDPAPLLLFFENKLVFERTGS